MKRLKTVLALCAVASTAAFAQTSFTLTGNIPEEHNGKTVYLVLLDGREKIDSTVVTSGKVSLKANLDTDAWVIAGTHGNPIPEFMADALKGIINY